MTRGVALNEKEVQRIVTLLTDTDMSIRDIATRMGCSTVPVIAINRRYNIRASRGGKKNNASADNSDACQPNDSH